MESSSNSLEPANLTLENYEEILFGNQITWLVDDTCSYRINIYTTPGGAMVKKRTFNGACFILNPRTGQLHVKVFHCSEWIGLRHVGTQVRRKTAEAVVDLVKSLPEEERPKQIIATRRGMVDLLEIKLWELPDDIVVRGSQLESPFPAFLKIDQLGDLVNKATRSHMVLFDNIYDDWLTRIPPNAAFSSLIVILRALLVNNKRAKMLLKPTKDTTAVKPSHLWPSFADDEWMDVEVALQDLILSEYAKRYNESPWLLTESEIRDYILGGETPSMRKKRQRGEEREAECIVRIKNMTTEEY